MFSDWRFEQKRKVLRGRLEYNPKVLIVLVLLTLTFIIWTIYLFPIKSEHVHRNEMLLASRRMRRALEEMDRLYRKEGLEISEVYDPNETGLIGVQDSAITTTLGDLQAKRTTTNPNFAGLVVRLLFEAGVEEGDKIAVGCSGSFPALLLATLSASEVMNLEPVIIVSLGSSMWGANRPNLTIIDIFSFLNQSGVFSYELGAVTLGGEDDVVKTLSKKGKDILMKKAKNSEAPFIYEPDLRQNVVERMKIYLSKDSGKPEAFVNIGGAWANMGTSSKILNLNPGINRLESIDNFPSKTRRGVAHEMLKRGISLVHLLHIKGLTMKYGLPWDPVPLPSVGQGNLYRSSKVNGPALILSLSIYLIITIVLLVCLRMTGLINWLKEKISRG